MSELVLNEVEGKEFFTIKMAYFHPYPQYSSIPAFQHSSIPVFHSDGTKRLSLKDY
jgi:hypothetical protein